MFKLDKFLEMIASATAAMFIQEGELAPRAVLWGETPEGQPSLILVPMMSSDKDLWRPAIHHAARETKATMLVLATEAWGVEETDKAAQEALREWAADNRSLEDHPRRIEILHYVAEDREGGHIMARQPITRDKDGKPSLGALKVLERGDYEGRLTGLMPPSREQLERPQ